MASGFLLVRCCLSFFFLLGCFLLPVRVTGAEGLGRIGRGVEALFLSACLKKVRLSFLWFVVFSPSVYILASLAGHRCVFFNLAMAEIEWLVLFPRIPHPSLAIVSVDRVCSSCFLVCSSAFVPSESTTHFPISVFVVVASALTPHLHQSRPSFLLLPFPFLPS